MLTAVSENLSVSPIEPLFHMDCRVKPGNDDYEKGKRSAERRIVHSMSASSAAARCSL